MNRIIAVITFKVARKLKIMDFKEKIKNSINKENLFFKQNCF